jgi:integrase
VVSLPFRIYDLLHTWATRAAEAGIDLVTLAAMLGHSRIQMVLRYAHPTQKHKTTAMPQSRSTIRRENGLKERLTSVGDFVGDTCREGCYR